MESIDVRSRHDLLEFLSQNAKDQYLDDDEEGVRQVAPLLKSYLVEQHEEAQEDKHSWGDAVDHAETISGEIVRLDSQKKQSYFLERLDDRFCLIHSVYKAQDSDSFVDRLVRGVRSHTDRAWIPSSLMLQMSLGFLSEYTFLAAPMAEIDTIDDIDLSDPLEKDLELSIPTDRVGYQHFRLVSNSPYFALRDLKDIYDSEMYAHRRSIDSLETRSRRHENEPRIVSKLYSSGKLISQTSTVESHMSEGRRVAELYGSVVRRIESDFGVAWSSGPNGAIRIGEVLTLTFGEMPIIDLDFFVESVFSGVSRFRLFGTSTRLGANRIDVEAVDLHRGDSISFEITPEWMRIYLPRESCGNVLCRLVWNLQRYFSSSISLSTSTGEMLFWEGQP